MLYLFEILFPFNNFKLHAKQIKTAFTLRKIKIAENSPNYAYTTIFKKQIDRTLIMQFCSMSQENAPQQHLRFVATSYYRHETDMAYSTSNVGVMRAAR